MRLRLVKPYGVLPVNEIVDFPPPIAQLLLQREIAVTLDGPEIVAEDIETTDKPIIAEQAMRKPIPSKRKVKRVKKRRSKKHGNQK